MRASSGALAALFVLALVPLISPNAAAVHDLSDSITEDDIHFYAVMVDTLSEDIVFWITWEDEYDDLDLYMMDPEGYIVANSTAYEGNQEEIQFTPNMTGEYTVGVYAWSTWRSLSYEGACSHPVTKLTSPFNGEVATGGEEEWTIDVGTTARPLFIRVFWDFEADDINITLREPSGDRLNEDGDFWGFGNALFYIIMPEETGNHSLWVRGLSIESSDAAAYTATCSFPVSEVTEPEPDNGTLPVEFFYWGAVMIFVALLGVAIVVTFFGRRKEEEGVYTVEEAFIVHRDGRLMYSRARQTETEDADLMSGMLVAIQGFIEQGLDSGAPLESIRYGDSELLIASGRMIVLALRVRFDPDEELKNTMEETVSIIEMRHGQSLLHWNGDLGAMTWMEGYLRPLLQISTADEQIQEVAASPYR